MRVNLVRCKWCEEEYHSNLFCCPKCHQQEYEEINTDSEDSGDIKISKEKSHEYNGKDIDSVLIERRFKIIFSPYGNGSRRFITSDYFYVGQLIKVDLSPFPSAAISEKIEGRISDESDSNGIVLDISSKYSSKKILLKSNCIRGIERVLFFK